MEPILGTWMCYVIIQMDVGWERLQNSERGIWGFISGQHHEPRPNKVPPIQYVLKNTCGNNE